MVRPIINYPAPIWFPQVSSSHQYKFEFAQNKALWIATGCNQYSAVSYLRTETGSELDIPREISGGTSYWGFTWNWLATVLCKQVFINPFQSKKKLPPHRYLSSPTLVHIGQHSIPRTTEPSEFCDSEVRYQYPICHLRERPERGFLSPSQTPHTNPDDWGDRLVSGIRQSGLTPSPPHQYNQQPDSGGYVGTTCTPPGRTIPGAQPTVCRTASTPDRFQFLTF